METETIYELKKLSGELIASNLPANYFYNASEISNKIKTDKCPISNRNIRHGHFKTKNGIIYLASYDVQTNKIFKRYFEACDFFIPSLSESISLQKTKTKNNFRRFKHNLISHHTIMLQELEKAFPISNSEKGIHNQIDFVKDILKQEPKETALSILKVIKSVNLMKSEFDVYDMLSSENPTLEFFQHYPHKLILLVLNPFWLELIEKGIKINVQECEEQITIDYKSIAVVFTHLFENTSKYIARNTSFDISFNSKDNMVEIIFEMNSLKIKKQEKDKIFNENYSGDFAKATTLSGNGIGLSIVKKLVELNSGNISVELDIEPYKRNKIMGIPFEQNRFKIQLPK
jgi:hypothetical protein